MTDVAEAVESPPAMANIKTPFHFHHQMLHIHKVGNVYYDNMHGLSVVTSYQPTVDLQSILRASKLWFREKEREREMV